jgi:predicted AlkP superfamily phosphohydrolase/phosphomutase
MNSRGPVIFVALDACDHEIARALANTGELPTLARLFGHTARALVRNPVGLFVGGLWMSFSTALRPDRHHFHCWDEIEISTYERRLTAPPTGDSPAPFWRALGNAGRRSAIIDVPHSAAKTAVNGLQIVEWGCHDRHFGFHTWPRSAAVQIESAFGLHPVLGLDAHSVREFAPDDYAHREGPLRSVEEEVTLSKGLVQGVHAKCKLCAALLRQDKWDLFLAVFGESHSVGHQQWHLHDENHPRFDRNVVAAMGSDPLRATYAALDLALGELLSHSPTDATVLVHLSHGMGPHHDGTHMLDEVLTRIDAFDRNPPPVRGALDGLKRASLSLPHPLLRQLTAFATPVLRRHAPSRHLPSAAEYATPAARAQQHFFMEPNNYVYGGVRLNLKGREPRGTVHPDDFDSTCAALTKDLLSLVNVATGDPVIRSVIRADAHYRRRPDDRIPDLFIDWVRRGPIETVWSPKTGMVQGPYLNWRSGDHRPDGLLFAYGPGIPTARSLPPIDLEDIAPSISSRLGVSLEDVDGKPVEWLCGT